MCRVPPLLSVYLCLQTVITSCSAIDCLIFPIRPQDLNQALIPSTKTQSRMSIRTVLKI